MSKGRKILIILFIVLIIIAIIVTAIIFKKKDTKTNLPEADEETLKNAGIDVNEEAYQEKEFYKDGNSIIIEGENNNKSIMTEDKEENQDMKEIPEEDKEKYTISDVEVKGENGKTTITGKILNKSTETKDIVVNIKFFSDDQKIKGAASEKVNVKPNENKQFLMKIQDDVSQYKYNIIAEYTN